MVSVEQALVIAREKVLEHFKCNKADCPSRDVSLWQDYCSYYGDIPPDGHTCGQQADNNYDDPKQSNPANNEYCDLEGVEFTIEWLHDVEAPNVPTPDSLKKYDLYWRCMMCDSLAESGELSVPDNT